MSELIDTEASVEDDEHQHAGGADNDGDEEETAEDRAFIAGEDDEGGGEAGEGGEEGEEIEEDEDDGGRRETFRTSRGLEVRGDSSSHQALDRKLERLEEAKMRADAAKWESKEGDDDDGFLDDGYDDDYDVDVQAALPQVGDPRLFLVKCDPGAEEMSVLKLMQKFAAQVEREDDTNRDVMSAFTTPASKGYIYIEASKDVYVRDAVKQIRALKHWSIRLVPIKEMVQAVTITHDVSSVNRGDWVRVKRGLYQGDLGQVVGLKDQNTLVQGKRARQPRNRQSVDNHAHSTHFTVCAPVSFLAVCACFSLYHARGWQACVLPCGGRPLVFTCSLTDLVCFPCFVVRSGEAHSAN
jgi:transcription elongation factor SPT5